MGDVVVTVLIVAVVGGGIAWALKKWIPAARGAGGSRSGDSDRGGTN